jgi:hypothetical protein
MLRGFGWSEGERVSLQLQTVTVERDELALTLKRIVRSTFSVGQAVEVLLPDSPEVTLLLPLVPVDVGR